MNRYTTQDIFDDIKSKTENYKERPSQIKAANNIESTLQISSKSKIFVLEAGCGFGKTFTYALPVLNEIALSDFEKKVLIVTSNISLQEQLCNKDIPFMVKTIKSMYPNAPRSFKGVLLKGKQNFICKSKLDSINKLGDYYPEKDKINDLLKWADNTATGDLSDFEFSVTPSLIREVNCNNDDCASKSCIYNESCFFKIHKEDLSDSNIVITNYHMLFTDCKMGNVILPSFDYIIFDECHEIQEIARNIHRIELSQDVTSKIISKLSKLRKHNIDYINDIVDMINTDKLSIETSSFLSQFEDKLTKFDNTKLIEDIGDINTSIRNSLLEELVRAYEVLLNGREKLSKKLLVLDETSKESAHVTSTLNTISSIMDTVFDLVELLTDLNKEDDNIVKYVENIDNIVKLNSIPLDISHIMEDNFYNKEGKRIIFSSATLSVNNNLDFFAESVGISDRSFDYEIGDTPFDMEKQQLWYLPKNAENGNTKEFESVFNKQLIETVTATGGGALCLFTSIKNMLSAKKSLKMSMPGMNILSQGDKSRKVLLDEFRDDIDSVLLGTKSMFTGVDIQGQSLRCLIIDKLPFPNPKDPIQQKLSKAKNSFYSHSIPSMIITLKQAVGRGVRTVDDKCVICILDGRMSTARYKRTIFDSFNYKKKGTREVSDIYEFIE